MSDADDYRAWKAWDAEGFARFDPVLARYFEAELAAAGVDITRPGAVLEIGFGNASFAGWATGHGWRYAGTELDTALVARGKALGLDVHTASEPIAGIAADGAFDLMVAFDVLEHLDTGEITELLGALRPKLAPGGRLIARFPSGDSPFSGPIQRGDLTHKSAIGSGMVEQFALMTGFEVVQIRAPAFPLGGLGLKRALRRAPVKFGRALAHLFCRVVFFDNQPRVTDPNMLIVLTLRDVSGAASR